MEAEAANYSSCFQLLAESSCHTALVTWTGGDYKAQQRLAISSSAEKQARTRQYALWPMASVHISVLCWCALKKIKIWIHCIFAQCIVPPKRIITYSLWVDIWEGIPFFLSTCCHALLMQSSPLVIYERNAYAWLTIIITMFYVIFGEGPCCVESQTAVHACTVRV